jgi:hypothetical protein
MGRIAVSGSENVQVPRERLKEIARAIADGRRDEAEALYRQASGKTETDAAAFVSRLAAQLKTKHPECRSTLHLRAILDAGI